MRYYEQIGLIQPVKKEDFTYRTYDESTVVRLQQIIILRKLRIPLKQIAEILKCKDIAIAIKAFQQNLIEIEGEITALSTIKSVIQALLERLKLKGDKLQLLDDESLLKIVDSLTVSKINFKEDKSMEELNQAGDMINHFVLESNLLKIKPDIRHFGFDCSAGKTGVGEPSRKYHMWVSIPDDMEVPKPLVKRTFDGGLYATHMIKMGDFDHWIFLRNWVMNNDKYEHDWCSVRCAPYEDDMERCFEEQLNYWGNLQNPEFKNDDMQLDLLFPIKEKK